MRRIISLFLIFLSTLCADWDPAECCPDADLDELEDPIFLNLKQDTINYLDGSWCTVEKTHLLMDLILLTKPKVCVEIGVFDGASLLPVVRVLKYLQSGFAYGIDAWSNQVATENMAPNDPNLYYWTVIPLGEAYNKAVCRLEQKLASRFCQLIQATSEEASSLIDEIDFLHIDGDFSEKGTLLDVQLYLPKVKKGGYILMSNVFWMVNGKAPKMRAFGKLFDACEMLCEIERDNAVLFQKN